MSPTSPQVGNHADAIDPGNSSAPSSWVRWLLPSIADLLFVALLLGLSCGALGRLLLRDSDSGWHIVDGQQILATHSVPRVDSFSSIMAGQAWYAWEWLYDLGMAIIHRAFGLNGVVFYTAAIIAATFVLMFFLALRRGGSLIVTLVLLLLSLGASSVHFLARPHVISWLFTVIWFELIDSARTNESLRTRLYLLPVLTIAWVNLHGGFVLGFVLLAIYIVGALIDYSTDRENHAAVLRWLKTLSIILGLSFLVSFINPYGYHLHTHIYRYLTDRFLMNQISEFLSPDFHGAAQQCFAILLIVAFIAVATAREKFGTSRLLVLLFAAYSGCYATRNLPTSSLLITLLIAPVLSHSISQVHENPAVAPWLRHLLRRFDSFGTRMQRVELNARGHFWIIAVFVLCFWACMHHGRVGSTQLINAYFDQKRFPVEAADYITLQHLREPVFSMDYWGGYLIYGLYPDTKVVVDDRHDLYGDQFFKDFLKVILIQPGWDKALDQWHVNLVVMPSGSTLANILRLTPGWTTLHEDNTAVLFQRTTPISK